MGDALEIRRKRLRFRAWHRGLKEADLVLGPFADKHLARLSERELDEFERLLDAPDPDIFDWAAGRRVAPLEFAGIIRIIQNAS